MGSAIQLQHYVVVNHDKPPYLLVPYLCTYEEALDFAAIRGGIVSTQRAISEGYGIDLSHLLPLPRE